jgi:hypothetical protein
MNLAAKSKSLAFALGLWTLAVSAAAEAPSLSGGEATLQWVREASAADCVDGRELARRVEAKLQKQVFGAPRSATLLVEGHAQRTAEGFRAHLRTFDANGAPLGSREVLSSKASCDELSETVAVVLAIMVDPEAALGASAEPPTTPAKPVQSPEPAEAPSAPAVCEDAPGPSVVSSPPATPKLNHDASAFARVAYGHLPDVTFGLGAALEFGFAHWGGARIEGVGFFQRDENLAEVPDAGAQVRILYAGAQLCPLYLPHGNLRFSACAGVEAGAFQIRGYGLETRKLDGVSPLVNATLSARGAVRLVGQFSLYLGATLGLPLARTLFEATLKEGTRAELFEQGQWAGELDLGFGRSF